VALATKSIGTRRTDNASDNRGARKAQLRGAMLRHPDYLRMPSGVRAILDTMWEMSNKPRVGAPWVCGYAKVRTIARNAGRSTRTVHRALAWLRSAGWGVTKCVRRRFLQWTLFPVPSGNTEPQAQTPQRVAISAPKARDAAGTSSTPAEEARPLRQGCRNASRQECRNGHPPVPRPPVPTPPPPPTSSSYTEEEKEEIKNSPQTEQNAPDAGVSTPAPATPVRDQHDALRAFLGYLGVFTEVIDEIIEKHLVDVATARATWDAVQRAGGSVGALVKRLRAGEVATPRPRQAVVDAPPRLDVTDKDIVTDPIAGRWHKRLCRASATAGGIREAALEAVDETDKHPEREPVIMGVWEQYPALHCSLWGVIEEIEQHRDGVHLAARRVG